VKPQAQHSLDQKQNLPSHIDPIRTHNVTANTRSLTGSGRGRPRGSERGERTKRQPPAGKQRQAMRRRRIAQNRHNTSPRHYTRAVEVGSCSVHENAHAVGATTSALNVAFVELRCVRIPARRSCSQAATEAHSCAFVS